MENYLKAVAQSYDIAIELGRRGIDPYRELPPHITSHPDYPLFLAMQESGELSDSGRREIAEFLAPQAGMRFADLGCCLNLMFRGYRDWPSLYYGVDISPKTVDLLQAFVRRENIPCGALVCRSMHDTAFASDFFDIAACIGSLEYFAGDFAAQVLAELHRVLKPGARAVLDIPRVGSREFGITAMIEESLRRPDRFDLSIDAFEQLLSPRFTIDHRDTVGPMFQYFLVCKK